MGSRGGRYKRRFVERQLLKGAGLKGRIKKKSCHKSTQRSTRGGGGKSPLKKKSQLPTRCGQFQHRSPVKNQNRRYRGGGGSRKERNKKVRA